MIAKPSYEDLEKRVKELEQRIAERDLARKEKAENEELLNTLIRNLPVLVNAYDREKKFTFWNSECAKVTGYSPQEIVGNQDAIDMLYPDYINRDRFDKELMVGSALKSWESVLTTKDGKKKTIAWSNISDVLPESGFEAWSIGIDITQRKQMEKALHESQERYRRLYKLLRLITDNVPDMIWAKNLKGQFIFVNQAICSNLLMCESPEKAIGKKESYFAEKEISAGYTYNFGETSVQSDAAVIKKRGPGRFLESGIIRDRFMVLDVHKAPLFDDDGRIIGIVGCGRDVTKEKENEDALKESEERFNLALKGANDGLWDWNMETSEIYFSPRWKSMLGYGEGEIGNGIDEWFDRLHPDDYMAVQKHAENFRLKRIKKYEMEYRMRHKKGHYLNILARGFGVTNKQGDIIRTVGTHVDITDRKAANREKERLLSQLHKSQKMEALGLLAGGVAHDLNNILSGIVGYPELLLLDLDEDSPLTEPLESIKDSGQRAAAVVEDLLNISRGITSNREIIELNDVINDYMNSPEYLKLNRYYPGVTITTDLEESLMNIKGSVSHIRKTLMNLVINAVEAVKKKGIVSISTQNVYIDRKIRGYDDINIGEYIVLKVHDNGVGIPEDDLERIFEPFYTKKVMGRSGTGLGLVVVWNTMKDHNGYIEVTSNENGTSFELYFPITRDTLSDTESGDDMLLSRDNIKGNGEKILVVDDEDRQKEIACKMLKRLGYSVEGVSSGNEAVRYLQKRDVDILVLDMIMEPGMNGRETYEKIIQRCPGQKAIIASGYAETDEVKEAQRLGAGQYIRKPYVIETIGMAVKGELMRARGKSRLNS